MLNEVATAVLSVWLAGAQVAGPLASRDPDMDLAGVLVAAAAWPFVAVGLGTWYALAWVPEPRGRR